MAIMYGADAVYLGGEQFGLRAYAGNFSLGDLKEGIDFAHSRGKKVYLTMNIIPHNEDFEGMPEYIRTVRNAGVDAIIFSDPGVFDLIRREAPDMELHLSTQANNTNWRSALFWHRLGVKRIILARELSLDEIREIRKNTPRELNSRYCSWRNVFHTRKMPPQLHDGARLKPRALRPSRGSTT